MSGKVAVVTGAASGIGKGLAERFAKEGMKVALADVEADALESAAKEVESLGGEVLAVPTDVSDRSAVEALADHVYEKLGSVNLLCNNAGVSTGGARRLWETTANDWSWVLGVNLMGVVHGVQVFLPRMIASGETGHIVNTSSILGVGTGKGSVYAVTKHGVARFTEGLYYELREAGLPIGVSLLCPGLIATGIINSDRNRPQHLRDEDESPTPERQMIRAEVERLFSERGMPPAEVAEIVMQAIGEGRFYIFTHPEMLDRVEDRMKGILQGTPPESGTRGMEEVIRDRLQEPKGDR